MDYKYEIKDTSEIITPQLVYYKDIIIENIRKAINLAGSAERLWPHVKSHKTAGMVKLQMEMGIKRFKCATIAEAEMVADCGAEDILLAYPLVGPNIQRFISLEEKYPRLRFWAIGEDYGQLALLSEESLKKGVITRVLLDVNMGMNRTGVAMESTEGLYGQCARLEGIAMMGLHCYDGNHNDPDLATRKERVAKKAEELKEIRNRLEGKKLECPVLVMGGTPSFPCHAEYPDVFLSPGTAFLQDAGYYKGLPDMDFMPAAVVLSRVVSHPSEGRFTLDLGYKGIAADPASQRGYIVGGDRYEPEFQNEEHWVFRVKEGQETSLPEIGSVVYVIPTHICPTSALYPSVFVVEDGVIVENWEVKARNRKITV